MTCAYCQREGGRERLVWCYKASEHDAAVRSGHLQTSLAVYEFATAVCEECCKAESERLRSDWKRRRTRAYQKVFLGSWLASAPIIACIIYFSKPDTPLKELIGGSFGLSGATAMIIGMFVLVGYTAPTYERELERQVWTEAARRIGKDPDFAGYWFERPSKITVGGFGAPGVSATFD
jgi:hypothetical protein